MMHTKSHESKPEKPGHPPLEAWQLRRRLMILLVIIVVLSAAIILTIVWQQHNQAQAARVTGSWYCEEDGVQYTFDADGTFSSTNGQQILLSGTWKAGWPKKTLIISYLLADETRQVETDFSLSADLKQLKLHNVNNKTLNMQRLPDS